MDKNIFVVNSGSTSIKVAVISMPREQKIISFVANGVTLELCTLEEKIHQDKNSDQIEVKKQKKIPFADHSKILELIFARLKLHKCVFGEHAFFGHRFVTGGEFFHKSVIYSSELDKQLRKIEQLAPLHNPINFKVLQIIRKLIPESKHVLVFDTSFHSTIAIENYIYPIPYKYYEDHAIRKYGAHGSSYRYILRTMSNILGVEKLNLIVCHVGGGVSICAIKNSKSLNTSMGLTPLGGAIMATRTGDLDPSVYEAVTNLLDGDAHKTASVFNQKSGLVGITNDIQCADFRFLIKQAREKNKKARLALAMFTQRIIDYIGQYYFQLHGDIHAIILTGGIGENSLEFRNIVFNTLGKVLGIKLNPKKAQSVGDSFLILNEEKGFPLFCVLETNEEKIIALDTFELLP